MRYLESKKYKSKTIHLYSATFFCFFSTQTWLLFKLEFASTTDILTPISTDHSPVFFSLSQEKGNIRNKGFWKFNSSLIKDQKCVNEIKDLIRNSDTKNNCHLSRQLRRKFLKYEIRKFTIHYNRPEQNACTIGIACTGCARNCLNSAR